MDSPIKAYKIEDWDSVEQCVYHCLTDPHLIRTPEHRIARLVAELCDKLVSNNILTEDDLDEVLKGAIQ